MMYWHDGMSWWMLLGSIWMLVFWGGIVTLVVWGVRKITERGKSDSNTAQRFDPLNIARERYARGDISREEFDRMKKDLM